MFPGTNAGKGLSGVFPNNSGKTAALQALALWDVGLRVRDIAATKGEAGAYGVRSPLVLP